MDPGDRPTVCVLTVPSTVPPSSNLRGRTVRVISSTRGWPRLRAARAKLELRKKSFERFIAGGLTQRVSGHRPKQGGA